MRDCLVLVDVFDDFGHEHGGQLLDSFLAWLTGTQQLLRWGRERRVPVVYANDPGDVFDGDMGHILERARSGPAGRRINALAPVPGDRFVVKPRYSAFDSTPLSVILRELEIERVVLAGMTTEGCVSQTAIAGKEEGFKVTVVPSACATIDSELERIALAYLERVVGVQLGEPRGALGALQRVSGSARGFVSTSTGTERVTRTREKERVVSQITTQRELFVHELGDILFVERQLASEALPKLISEVQDDEFRTALEEHLSQTKRHVRNVERVFELLGEEPSAERCLGFEGLKAEHEKMVEETSDDLIDSVDLGAAARTENYEIAAYEGLRRMAKAMRDEEAVELPATRAPRPPPERKDTCDRPADTSAARVGRRNP
jgi:ferritin-like metal-binding protein YciE/nicotinamidase-related amidase